MCTNISWDASLPDLEIIDGSAETGVYDFVALNATTFVYHIVHDTGAGFEWRFRLVRRTDNTATITYTSDPITVTNVAYAVTQNTFDRYSFGFNSCQLQPNRYLFGFNFAIEGLDPDPVWATNVFDVWTDGSTVTVSQGVDIGYYPAPLASVGSAPLTDIDCLTIRKLDETRAVLIAGAKNDSGPPVVVAAHIGETPGDLSVGAVCPLVTAGGVTAYPDVYNFAGTLEKSIAYLIVYTPTLAQIIYGGYTAGGDEYVASGKWVTNINIDGVTTTLGDTLSIDNALVVRSLMPIDDTTAIITYTATPAVPVWSALIGPSLALVGNVVIDEQGGGFTDLGGWGLGNSVCPRTATMLAYAQGPPGHYAFIKQTRSGSTVAGCKDRLNLGGTLELATTGLIGKTYGTTLIAGVLHIQEYNTPCYAAATGGLQRIFKVM